MPEYTITNAQEGRAAGVFALAALTGELAAEADLLPWDQTEARDAALVLYEKWKQARETSALGSEHAEILRRISDFIDKHADSRFSNISPSPTMTAAGHVIEPPVIRERAGYWDDSNGERVYLFTAAGLREATKGFEFSRVLSALTAAQAFTETGSANEKGKNTRTPERKTAYLYYIDPEKLI